MKYTATFHEDIDLWTIKRDDDKPNEEWFHHPGHIYEETKITQIVEALNNWHEVKRLFHQDTLLNKEAFIAAIHEMIEEEDQK